MRSSLLGSALALAGLLLLSAACGDDGGQGTGGGETSGSGGADDGKVRPAPSGVAIAEAAACAKVAAAVQERLTDLACAGTTRSCPDLIQAPSGAPSCAQYDEGTADGCAEHVRAGADCDDVRTRIDACIVAHIEGSEPAGCP